MKTEDVRVCVLRVSGTNCDAETKRALTELGVNAEVVHLNEIERKRNLLDYSALVFPGGFSYGDYVRAGAVWAARTLAKLRSDITRFIDDERLILGICNGFQVLVEAGLLPSFKGITKYPEASLGTNIPIGYNCRWVYIRHENSGRCIFTHKISKEKVLRIPVGHAEGRFLFSKENENRYLNQLYDNDQLVFRYCNKEGKYADGEFPVNPNGAFHDIAGICNPTGTVLGLMPHPERAFYGWQLPDWTKTETLAMYGDGKQIFESMVEYLKKRF
ncbi:MAG: phosphoribosylformylglycinamidine synthase subunit PurQ [Candidatus Bathyarchaeota archaeon]|nr:phosphoribosylformylglycinamidine synthase subunit PurQ [Candidatus Bathyarchaeota archaeon]